MAERTGERVRQDQKEKLAEGKTVLVLGGSGLVGSRFVEMFGGKNVLTPTHAELDITNPEAVKKFIREYNPDIVINFVAYTNVGKAQTEERGQCWKMNVDGVKNILDAIDPKKTRFIQISTDMVFSGLPDDPGPYEEDHTVNNDPEKLNHYGLTKAEAELLIIKRLRERTTIVRIVNPVRANFEKKKDYLRGPLEKYKVEGRLPYPLFSDQQISITFIDELCEALAKIVEEEHYGIFHIASSNTTYPNRIIPNFINHALGEEVLYESKVMSEDDKKRYPQFGGLDVRRTEKTLGMKFSHTSEIIEQLLRQRG